MMENQSKQTSESHFLMEKDVSIFLFDLSTFFFFNQINFHKFKKTLLKLH